MINQESKRTLELLIAKVDKLSNYSFFTENRELQFSISVDKDNIKSTLKGPTNEQIDAILLTFRLFIQDNDRISLAKLAKTVALDSSVTNMWKEEFNKSRNAINDFLDALPAIQAEINGQLISSRREIMNVFIYGDLSHMKENKQKKFEEWVSFPPNKALLKFYFIDIIQTVFNIIFYLATISKSEIEGKNIKS